mgnify:CR=1 FL=1
MPDFKDFGVISTIKTFTGDKIKMSRILNRRIEVLAFKIDTSKYTEKGNGKCLCLQIKNGDDKNIVFTGSVHLQDCIQQLKPEHFPFFTTIIKDDESYQFT